MLELAWGGPKGLLVTSEMPLLSEMDGDKLGSTPPGRGWWVEGLDGNGIPLPRTDLTFPCEGGGAIATVACLLLFKVRGVLCLRELGVEGVFFICEGFKGIDLR